MSRKPSKKHPGPRLADFMCFTVYATNLAYSRVYRPVLDHLGLTYPQYIAINALWERDMQTVKALSETLYLEPSTITPMLQRLEGMGYVRRVRDEKDQRSVLVGLTPAGRRLREKGLRHAEGTMQAAGLSPQEFTALQQAVARLRDNLVEAAQPKVKA